MRFQHKVALVLHDSGEEHRRRTECRWIKVYKSKGTLFTAFFL